MNNNMLNNDDSVNSNTYKATSNLNTAIENPQINVNSATGVNMQDLGYNNYADSTSNVNNDNSQFLNNSYDDQNFTNDVSNNINSSVDYNNTNNQNVDSYTYEPVMQEKKVKSENVIPNLLHSKEFKVIIFIIFILCLFLLVMPYIYDFFKNLRMSMVA